MSCPISASCLSVLGRFPLPQWCLLTSATLQGTALCCLSSPSSGSQTRLHLNPEGRDSSSSSDLPLWNSTQSPERTYGVCRAWTGQNKDSQIWGLRSPMKVGSPKAAGARAQPDDGMGHTRVLGTLRGCSNLEGSWTPTSLLSNVPQLALPPPHTCPPPLLGQHVLGGGREGQYGANSATHSPQLA